MEIIKKIQKYIRTNILRIFLFIIIILFLFYIFSRAVRLYLFNDNIDSNFIIGFLTSIALLLSLIQSSYDKKFNYNMRLVESIESKGLSIIGKLLVIKQKSEVFLGTLKRCKEAIQDKHIYKDLNDVSSKKDIEDGMELIAAYIQTYFNEECLTWNDVLNKLRDIGTYSNNIVVNYNENIKLIMGGVSFNNRSLDQIDFYINEAERINKEIDGMALEMTNRIVAKINDSTEAIKKSFNFKI